MKGHWSKKLVEIQACGDAVLWARTQSSLTSAWSRCDRGDWMVWIIGYSDRSKKKKKKLALCLLDCINLLENKMCKSNKNDIKGIKKWINGNGPRPFYNDRENFSGISHSIELIRALCVFNCYDLSDSYARAMLVDKIIWELRKFKGFNSKVADIVRKHFPNPPRLRSLKSFTIAHREQT